MNRYDPLRLCLVDMNNGVKNEATRCFRRLFEAFTRKVKAANPGLEVRLSHVQPRNLGELPTSDVDIVLSSGGPGAPTDGYDQPWCTGYRKFLDRTIEENLATPLTAPAVFVVCHSFEITVTHFAVARMHPRDSLKFGVFPAYVTDEGRDSVLLSHFGDRLFAWEHRSYETLDLDEKKLGALGGRLLATESRGDLQDKGRSLLGFEFAPGLVGTQFHPEADRPGVIAWINRPEHSSAVIDTYGENLYDRMIRTLDNPKRLAHTYALLIPGWLRHRFNEVAPSRGLAPIGAPEEDMRTFEAAYESTG